MWRPPWAASSGGAVEAHPTLEYQTIKGDKTCGDPPGQLLRWPSPKAGPPSDTDPVEQNTATFMDTPKQIYIYIYIYIYWVIYELFPPLFSAKCFIFKKASVFRSTISTCVLDFMFVKVR